MTLATSLEYAEAMATIHIDETAHNVVEIRATGDVILDVSFENTNACTKSIPSEVIQKLRVSKAPIPSARVFYRVRLETLKKHSKYFAHLLGSDVFGEGRSIRAHFAGLAESNLKPTEIEPDQLPRIKIIDEDDATRTVGRETVFRDMLRIIHGAEHLTKPLSTLYLAVLVILADRFDCLAPITRYVAGTFGNFKYPQTLDKSAEEILRQKILVFYHTNQAVRLASATKELILRGSSRWIGYVDSNPGFTTSWWDLPDGLESKISSSLKPQFNLYIVSNTFQRNSPTDGPVSSIRLHPCKCISSPSTPPAALSYADLGMTAALPAIPSNSAR
jgi:hypothetical protein